MIKAKYTIVLKTLMDDPEALDKIYKALSTYPLYVPPKEYDLIPTREELNRRLLNHHKYKEIGFETFGRFLDELEITMCEIMPHYNELLKTVEIMAELPSPFDNVDVVETFEETRLSESNTDTEAMTEAKSKTTDHSTTESNSKDVQSETPQDQLTIPAESIDTIPYADRAGWAKGSTENNAETNTDNDSLVESNEKSNTQATTEHTYTKKGNQGVNTYAHDMNEFRTSIIDVVNQIVNDPRIAELFMLLY